MVKEYLEKFKRNLHETIQKGEVPGILDRIWTALALQAAGKHEEWVGYKVTYEMLDEMLVWVIMVLEEVFEQHEGLAEGNVDQFDDWFGFEELNPDNAQHTVPLVVAHCPEVMASWLPEQQKLELFAIAAYAVFADLAENEDSEE